MAEADFEALWADARRLYAESASQSDLKDAITPQTVDDLLDKIRVQNFEYEYFRKKQVHEDCTRPLLCVATPLCLAYSVSSRVPSTRL